MPSSTEVRIRIYVKKIPWNIIRCIILSPWIYIYGERVALKNFLSMNRLTKTDNNWKWSLLSIHQIIKLCVYFFCQFSHDAFNKSMHWIIISSAISDAHVCWIGHRIWINLEICFWSFGDADRNDCCEISRTKCL